jgi:hypothetical protein
MNLTYAGSSTATLPRGGGRGCGLAAVVVVADTWWRCWSATIHSEMVLAIMILDIAS